MHAARSLRPLGLHITVTAPTFCEAAVVGRLQDEERDEEYSATLKAARYAHAQLSATTTDPHHYYLV